MREGILFIARTIVQRTQPGQRQSVKNAEYLCHVYVRSDSGIAAIVVADGEYPTTGAFSVISKVLEEFLQQHGDTWQSVEADSQLANDILDPALLKYQVGLGFSVAIARSLGAVHCARSAPAQVVFQHTYGTLAECGASKARQRAVF